MGTPVYAAGIKPISVADAQLERVRPSRVTNPTAVGAKTLSCFNSLSAVSLCT